MSETESERLKRIAAEFEVARARLRKRIRDLRKNLSPVERVKERGDGKIN